MIQHAYIKAPSEADWVTLLSTHLLDKEGVPLPGVEVDTLGVIFNTTGETTEIDGMTVPTVAAVPGWHVNLTLRIELPEALRPYCVNPQQPKRVFFGSYGLAMPEVLEDDGDTLMLERSIGSVCTNQQRDAAEIEYVRRKLSAEEREDRKALRAALLAVVEQRAIRNLLVTERDRLTTAIASGVTERNLLLDLRGTELGKRDLAVTQMVGTTGAVRAALVVAREAAAAEVVRINAALTEESRVRDELQVLRGSAGTAVITANTELLRLREVVASERS